MSGVLERAKGHFAALRPEKIDVPEWGPDGKPLVVTWSALTVAQRRRIAAPLDDGSRADPFTMAVRAVILKACDEAGAKLFDEMDEHALNYDVDSEVVERIGVLIMYGKPKSRPADGEVEDQKNG